MNSSEDIKHSLKLVKMIFFLALYVHLTGCVWIYINQFSPKGKQWIPPDLKSEGITFEEFDNLHWKEQWTYCFYYAILVLMGNDINPKSKYHYYSAYCFLISGAFINA